MLPINSEIFPRLIEVVVINIVWPSLVRDAYKMTLSKTYNCMSFASPCTSLDQPSALKYVDIEKQNVR